LNPLWLIVFGVETLLLRAGFALQACGSLRAKNATGSILRLTADTAVAAISFWAIGAALLLSPSNKLFAFDSALVMGPSSDRASITFFHLVISLIGGAIITGALAERARFYVGVIAAAVLAGLVIPITGHWLWLGWLHDLGAIDHGGASVIHLSAAVFAAVGVAVVGARAGKYNRDGSSDSIAGHALPLLGAGSILSFVGWFPYLLGCTLAHWGASETGQAIVAMNIMLAGAGGVCGGLLLGQFRYRKPDVFFVYSGFLGALVAISPGAVAVTGSGALMIGLVAGVIVPLAAMAMDSRAHLDDPLGLIAIHGVGSIWGLIAVSLFVVLGQNALFVDHLHILAVQLLVIVAILVPTAIVAAAVFLGLKAIGGVRVSEADEIAGLDLADHGLNSYPDFLPAPDKG
jgi:Amt family ammonium transporter